MMVVLRQLSAWFMALLVALLPTFLEAQQYHVVGEADGLVLSQDEDDGPDFDAEIQLTVTWELTDEEQCKQLEHVSTKEIAHNWDDVAGQLSNLGLLQGFTDEECAPADYIYVTVHVTESDLLGTFGVILATAAGIVVGITVATALSPAGVAAPLGAKVAGAAAGALVGAALKKLEGVEDLGSLKNQRLALGQQSFVLTGTDGGSSVRLADNSSPSSSQNLECGCGKRALLAAPTPDDAVAGIYPAILDSLAQVPLVDREGSMAAGPGDEGVRALRETLTAMLLALAEIPALYAMTEAQIGYLNASDSLALLAAARAHAAAGEAAEAVIDYREAFRTAYTAVYDGNIGASFALTDQLTLNTPVLTAYADDSRQIIGWVQGMSGTESLDGVDVTGQAGGMQFNALPGVARTAVVLAGDLGPGLIMHSSIGLGRTSGGVVRGPDAGCDEDHLEEGSIGGGIFIDEQGPYFEPDPGGCGYGEVVQTYQPIDKGGTPAGIIADSHGFFTLDLTLGPDLEIGRHNLVVTAQISDSGGGNREISTPLTLIAPGLGAIFTDGFESGDVSAWSSP